jgi:hypothetical protein
MTLTMDNITDNTSINLIDVLDQVKALDEYRDYKAVTLSNGLDSNSYIWLSGVYQGSVNWGLSSNFLFNLKRFVDDGILNKVLSK